MGLTQVVSHLSMKMHCKMNKTESKPEFQPGLSWFPWPLPILWPSLTAPATPREVRNNFLMHCLKMRFMFIEFRSVMKFKETYYICLCSSFTCVTWKCIILFVEIRITQILSFFLSIGLIRFKIAKFMNDIGHSCNALRSFCIKSFCFVLFWKTKCETIHHMFSSGKRQNGIAIAMSLEMKRKWGLRKL